MCLYIQNCGEGDRNISWPAGCPALCSVSGIRHRMPLWDTQCHPMTSTYAYWHMHLHTHVYTLHICQTQFTNTVVGQDFSKGDGTHMSTHLSLGAYDRTKYRYQEPVNFIGISCRSMGEEFWPEQKGLQRQLHHKTPLSVGKLAKLKSWSIRYTLKATQQVWECPFQVSQLI